VGAHHEENPLQNSLHNDVVALVSQQKSFQIDPKRFQKVATELKKNYLTEFSTD